MYTYTIAGKTDGFGAQYHAIMSGFAICQKYNLTYVHTKIAIMEHGEDVDKMNAFIGIPQSARKDVMLSEKFAGEVHYSDTPSAYYTPPVIKQIREWYYSSEKPQIQQPDIAIHIRRGDVDKTSGRYTDNSYYINKITNLRILYPTYKVLIFSEGALDDFKDFNLPQESFKLNVDICETFHSLVKAKILVMSKSSLSYAAAILNENTIYYEDFWHKPLDTWLKV